MRATLNYRHYNFCHVVKTLRVTPSMQAGVTDHVWSIEDYNAIMSAEPVEAQALKPLAHRKPSTTPRELPDGRGVLHAVPPSKSTPRVSVPPTTPAAPAQPSQLGLFDKPEEPA